ncbi:hypothetical protein ACFWNN_07700 [Lentzea sp. NPDC058450]|uniref:hypothetical protein n=1 Tax=Lentzea sp. NPDC058450 TaxID=3346505 RepID=UPI0036684359
MTARTAPADETEFVTSGHSGDPVRWSRTRVQLETEAVLVATEFGEHVEQIVNFAPPSHLYGNLFGRVLPELLGLVPIDLWGDPLATPALDTDKRTLFVCLPSSWMVLRSLSTTIGSLPGAAVLHGAGPTTAVARKVAAELNDLTGFRAVEVFGSTETGAVAVRDVARPEPWRLLSDVDVHDGPAERLLKVRSGRIGRRADMVAAPEWWELNDVVRFVGDRTFEFVGRSSRLIKVNGVRCRLDQVENAVRAGLPDVDVVCVAVRDAVRGEHYELFHTDPGGAVRTETIWRQLAGFPVPRAVYRVGQIPRTITGKAKVDRLYAAVRG